MPKVDREKSGPPVQFWQKKWTRGVHFFLPKVDLPCQKWKKSGPGPVSLPRVRQVHFWQGKKVDPVQFHCRNPGRSNFGKGKKWTRSSFTARIHFWQGKKVDPVQFRCRNPGRSNFGKGKKVDPVQFRCRNPGRFIFWQREKWTRSSFAAESCFFLERV